MGKTSYWKFIEGTCVEFDDELCAEHLKKKLGRMSAKELISFYEFVKRKRLDAFRSDIWAAGSLINNRLLSDDGFHYFRCWLVSLGKRRYEMALDDPDSLADLDVRHWEDTQFESYCYAVTDVYESLTGNDIGVNAPGVGKSAEALLDLPTWEEYSVDMMKNNLPRLWAKYGAPAADVAREGRNSGYVSLESANVDGIGRLVIGSEVVHESFGVGRVKKLVRVGSIYQVQIEYSEGVHWMALVGDLFRLLKIR